MSKHLLAGASLLLAGILGNPAFAQDTPPPPAADDTTDTPPSEIVVTAQRRSESLLRVPLSVTALTAESLAERHINDLTALTIAAPSLQVNFDNSFAIRGVGTVGVGTGLENSVAFAVDEVNLVNRYLVDNLLNDAAQVEVLDGPQGLLFDKNASAGLINVTTIRPSTRAFEAGASIEGGWRDTVPTDGLSAIGRGYVNAPLSDRLALRVNGYYSTQDPSNAYRGVNPQNTDRGHDQFGGRAKLLFDPGTGLQIYVIGTYSEEHGIAFSRDFTFRALAPNGLQAAPAAAAGVIPGPNNLVLTADGAFQRDITRGGVQAKVSYEFSGGWELSNIVAWNRFTILNLGDPDLNNLDYASFNAQRTRSSQFTNELRLALPTNGRISGQVGLYYFNAPQTGSNVTRGLFGTPPAAAGQFPFCVGAVVGTTPRCPVSRAAVLGGDSAWDIKNESYAAFGQLTAGIVDGARLIAGGRVTRDVVRQTLVQNRDLYLRPLGATGTFVTPFSNTQFNWKLGAEWDVAPQTLAYGFYTTGYKGPGFNNISAAAASAILVRPETVRSAQIGIKSAVLDRRVTIDLAAFDSRFRNFQITAYNGDTGSFFTQNAASVVSRGVQAAVTARATRSLSLSGSAIFLDSYYGDFPGAQCTPGQIDPGCATTGSFNARGLRTPVSARFTFTGQIRYERDIAADWRAFVQADGYHRSSVNYATNNARGATYGAVDTLGLSLGVRGPMWDLSLFCRNCSDQRVPNAIQLDLLDSLANRESYVQSFGLNSFRTFGLAAVTRFR